MSIPRPLHDNIVVRKTARPVDQIGSIYIPEESQEVPTEGEILAVGPGKYNRFGILLPNQARVGDLVLFGKYTGHEVLVDGREYIIMRDTDIMCVIPPLEEAA